jgi:NADH dehydrogenase I D subunit
MKNNNTINIKNMAMNFGPQHPAAHGVLRLILEVAGETIVKADPHIGLLHRGTEKLVEYKTYNQILPYLDRLDYVSIMAQEYAFSILIEDFLNIKILDTIVYIRILFLEITRILNHLLAISTHALDVGAMTPFLWAFEEREKLMEFYEQASGARLHAAYIRPGGVHQIITPKLLEEIAIFASNFPRIVDEIEDLLTDNRIWKQRLVNIGVVTNKDSASLAFSGVMARGSGFNWDLRKESSISDYNNFKFKIPVEVKGDCYARYKIRVQEMRESCTIINQCVLILSTSELSKPSIYDNRYIRYTKTNYSSNLKSRYNAKIYMESLIQHFKFYTESYNITGEAHYKGTEAPKGEFGIFLVPGMDYSPYRCKFRAPGFAHLQSLHHMSVGHMLADVVTIIGTQDIVFGEVDR